MTRITYRRKYLIGAHVSIGIESIVIMTGSMVAERKA